MTSSEHPKAALLLVDVQRDFASADLGPLGEGYLDRVAGLLAAVRREGLLVVHVHSQFEPDGSDWMRRYRRRGRIPCVRGTEGAEVPPEAAPAAGEPVVVKHTFDAFLQPELDRVLRSHGVEVLLVAGLVTSTCVLLTASSAMQHGYLVAVVEDATADLPEVHEAVLAQYPYVFDRVCVDELSRWVPRALADSLTLGPLPS